MQVRIKFVYSNLEKEHVDLPEGKAEEELIKFLNRLPEASKKEWIASMKGENLSERKLDTHYDWISQRFQKTD